MQVDGIKPRHDEDARKQAVDIETRVDERRDAPRRGAGKERCQKGQKRMGACHYENGGNGRPCRERPVNGDVGKVMNAEGNVNADGDEGVEKAEVEGAYPELHRLTAELHDTHEAGTDVRPAHEVDDPLRFHAGDDPPELVGKVVYRPVEGFLVENDGVHVGAALPRDGPVGISGHAVPLTGRDARDDDEAIDILGLDGIVDPLGKIGRAHV